MEMLRRHPSDLSPLLSIKIKTTETVYGCEYTEKIVKQKPNKIHTLAEQLNLLSTTTVSNVRLMPKNT